LEAVRRGGFLGGEKPEELNGDDVKGVVLAGGLGTGLGVFLEYAYQEGTSSKSLLERRPAISRLQSWWRWLKACISINNEVDDSSRGVRRGIGEL
jgi:hypothetical protein